MDEQRDNKGRFTAGNSAGVGNGRPRKVVEQAYLSEILDVVSVAEWRKVVLKALKDAQKGAPEARRWLAEYIIGKPPTILELRASEAAQLKELLSRLEARGMAASDVFNEMLSTFAALDAEVMEADADAGE